MIQCEFVCEDGRIGRYEKVSLEAETKIPSGKKKIHFRAKQKIEMK